MLPCQSIRPSQSYMIIERAVAMYVDGVMSVVESVLTVLNDSMMSVPVPKTQPKNCDTVELNL